MANKCEFTIQIITKKKQNTQRKVNKFIKEYIPLCDINSDCIITSNKNNLSNGNWGKYQGYSIKGNSICIDITSNRGLPSTLLNDIFEKHFKGLYKEMEYFIDDSGMGIIKINKKGSIIEHLFYDITYNEDGDMELGDKEDLL